MPIVARQRDKSIIGPDLSSEDWVQLKASSRNGATPLTMPCCGARAIPKTSSTGFQFFAHYHEGQRCSTGGGESLEHLQAKHSVYQAAASAGWQVTIEAHGTTSAGQAWIADVLCMKDDTLKAFEIQLTPQDPLVLADRQALYKASGVRAAWLYGSKAWKRLQHAYKPSQDTPVVILSDDGTVALPKARSWPGETPIIPLEQFVKGSLNGWLRWYDASRQRSQPSCLETVQRPCYRCKAWIEVVDSLRQPLDGMDMPMIHMPHDHALYDAIDLLRQRRPKLTPVRVTWSETLKKSYPMAICPLCGAKQGNNFRPSRSTNFYRNLHPLELPTAIGEEGSFWRWGPPGQRLTTWFEESAPAYAERLGRTRVCWP